MTTEMILAGEKYADDRRWHVDTTLKILDLVCVHGVCCSAHCAAGRRVCARRLGGQHCQSLCRLASPPAVHRQAALPEPRCAHLLLPAPLMAMQENINQQAPCQVGSWAIGEFGDMLINAVVDEVPLTVGSLCSHASHSPNNQVSENEVLDLLNKVLIATTSTAVCQPNRVRRSSLAAAGDPPVRLHCPDEAEHAVPVQHGSHPHHGWTHDSSAHAAQTVRRSASMPPRTRRRSSSAQTSTRPSSTASTTCGALFGVAMLP